MSQWLSKQARNTWWVRSCCLSCISMIFIWIANPLTVHKSGVLWTKMEAMMCLRLFKKSWILHLGELYFHAVEKRVPTHQHHQFYRRSVLQMESNSRNILDLMLKGMPHTILAHRDEVLHFLMQTNKWDRPLLQALLQWLCRACGININHLRDHLHYSAISYTKASHQTWTGWLPWQIPICDGRPAAWVLVSTVNHHKSHLSLDCTDTI